ncbi:MAG: glycosyltransferase family 8 C-terminal domain-containing protein [Candidatus Malihini olakiniferum]
MIQWNKKSKHEFAHVIYLKGIISRIKYLLIK